MSTLKVVRPVISIGPKVVLRDDVMEVALANGFTQHDVDRLEAQEEYRREYNQRPEVVAKRKAYSAARYARLQTLKRLLKNIE